MTLSCSNVSLFDPSYLILIFCEPVGLRDERSEGQVSYVAVTLVTSDFLALFLIIFLYLTSFVFCLCTVSINYYL